MLLQEWAKNVLKTLEHMNCHGHLRTWAVITVEDLGDKCLCIWLSALGLQPKTPYSELMHLDPKTELSLPAESELLLSL